jgi:hypothetical protein
MLKNLFNILSLGTSTACVAFLGYEVIELRRDLGTDPRLAYAESKAQLNARRAIILMPERDDLASYALSDVHVAAMAPDCTNKPPADPALCAWIAFDEGRIARRAPYGAVTNDAQAHFEHMRDYQPPESYRAWERERARAAADAIAADPFIRDNFLRVKKQNRYTDLADAQEQSALKQNLAQRTLDLLREAYGLPPIPVTVHYIKGESPSLRGYFVSEKPHIVINYNIESGLTGSYDAMLSTLMHEGRHSIDADYAHMLLTGKMAHDDVRAPHAAAILLNHKEYIFSRSADFIDPGFVLLENAYTLQYMERTAFTFGNAQAAAIVNRLYCKDVDMTCVAAKTRRALDF